MHLEELHKPAGCLVSALAGFVLATPPAPAWGQQSTTASPPAVEMGAQHYRVYCASCHGREGAGDGPVADYLRFAPPDLRKMARRNRGKFDFDTAYKMIDGREAIAGHGGPDMPIWGDAFLEAREGYSREKVRERITQLVRYLESIQAPNGR
jgi:mono/diheme cytochrome c family protein